MEDLYNENDKILVIKMKDDKISGNTFHIQGLEELILLKCQYYAKRSTDSMQSLLKFQRYFLQK